ncbi:MAG: XRE family transcriptional regulator [Acidobacteria bacterium]|nr:MAG: XRE family transcriptional regulator [Acidobacteriota bacterium]
MEFHQNSSDQGTLEELGRRLAHHRLNINWTQGKLAKEAGVSQRTVHRLECGHSAQTSNLIRILRALRLLENLEALVPAPAASPIQQLKLHGKKRQRASSSSDGPKLKKPWSWRDKE